LISPLYPGVPVGTHTGTGILLGIPPGEAAKLTRGPVEAAGIGLSSEWGDILIRCNFATLEESGESFRIIDRRAGRISEGTQELARELVDVDLGNGISATLSPATQHRAVLKLSGEDLSPAISDTDPGSAFQDKGVIRSAPQEAGTAAARTAHALNRFLYLAHEHLNTHPVNRIRRDSGLLAANGILCRSAGKNMQLISLVKRLGIKGCVIAGESTVIGLARILKFQVVSEPGFTSLPNTDLKGKVTAARAALDENDIVFLHVKGPDICAHDKKPAEKKAVLEAFDEALALLQRDDLVIAVTGDHSTNSNTGDHTGDPVPSLLYSPQGRRDLCNQFGESYCAAGGLGQVSATGFLCSMLDAMGFMHKFKPGESHLFTPIS
jgi:2,3-bisphosphoglycerate-independent phosphoglycerate mutase